MSPHTSARQFPRTLSDQLGHSAPPPPPAPAAAVTAPAALPRWSGNQNEMYHMLAFLIDLAERARKRLAAVFVVKSN